MEDSEEKKHKLCSKTIKMWESNQQKENELKEGHSNGGNLTGIDLNPHVHYRDPVV